MANRIETLKKTVDHDIQRIPEEYLSNEYIQSDQSIWRKICIGIVTCDATKSRFLDFMKVHSEIFERFNIDYFVIRSDPDIETEDEKDYVIDGHNFTARFEETYETLHKKIITFYSYLSNNTEYSHVIKIDDGCLLDLSQAISNLNLDFVGTPLIAKMNKYHQGKCTDPKWNSYVSDFKHELDELIGEEEFNRLNLTKTKYAAGGCAYRLSRKAIDVISNYLEYAHNLEFAYEDLLIGQLLKINHITVNRNNMGKHHRIPK